MARLVLPTYTVVRDTREKVGYGWSFGKTTNTKRRPPNCSGTIITKLDTGDYSIEGYEDILAIERKEGFTELWSNYTTRARFEEEMGRMSEIKHSYILIESHLDSDILTLSPPQFSTKVPGKALIRWLLFLGIKYGVKIIPVGNCGKKMAQFIIEEVIRHEKDRWVSNGS